MYIYKGKHLAQLCKCYSNTEPHKNTLLHFLHEYYVSFMRDTNSSCNITQIKIELDLYSTF